MKWGPQDIIAMVVIVGCFVLIGIGFNGALKYTLLGMVGAYYGLDLTPFIKIGRNIGPPKKGGDNGS